MRFNFHVVYISRICNFHVFCIFKFAIAGCSGVEIFTGEIFANIKVESVYRNSIRQLQRCKTCCTRCWIRLKMSSYQMESCIRDFTSTRRYGHLSVEKGWLRPRKSNREDLLAVAIKRGTETVGHVLRTISCACTLFLRQHGFISCEVPGSSRPSLDLTPF